MSIVQFVEQTEKIGEFSGKEFDVSKGLNQMTQLLYVPVRILTDSVTLGQVGMFPEPLVQIFYSKFCR